LNAISGAFKSSDKIVTYFTDPFVAEADKVSALVAVAGETGMAATTVKLVEVVAENRRMNIIADIADVYARILLAESGHVPCHVSSAIPLNAEQVKQWARKKFCL
jgi:F0F1-type ATP synthase delta subunit